MELTVNERRVLGVLIEKGYTTPLQYPLSLNSLTLGCNQKSCRDPLMQLGEDAVLDALDSLRGKGLATLVRSGDSRIDRFRHEAGEALSSNTKELALLAEMLLRGPQTDGELRQRAGRMKPFDSLDEVRAILDGLSAREEAIVLRLGPAGRRRGVKYAHTLCPAAELPEIPDPATFEEERRSSPKAPSAQAMGAEALERFESELDALRHRLSELEARLARLGGA